MSQLAILNAAAYKFVQLGDLGQRRGALQSFCRERHLRGTILLSPEGLNLYVAGRDEGVESLLEFLQNDAAIGTLDVKRSRSADLPFRRMLVRVKREIIAFGVSSVDPQRAPSPKIAARELKSWLDEGRSLTLLDVRNDYEVEVGTFAQARPIGVGHFRDFPGAVEQLPAELKQQPIVMFCTGGIRCEKAGPMMQQAGFENVFQLDGGILRYFEECGGAHYRGDCFVFDQRVALDPALRETDAVLCYACQAVLTDKDQNSPKYVPPESCPHCYRTPEVRMSDLAARRKAQILAATTPLPGRGPYENRRPLNVPARFDAVDVLTMLQAMHPHVTEEEWRRSFEEGLIVLHGTPLTPDFVVRAGQRIERIESETREPDVNPHIEILFEDAMLVVVNKPAPLPMHPSGRYHRNTLNYILDQVYAPQRLRIAHRLDANTTGVVVLSRTKNVASRIQPQFEQGRVKKRYVARVIGRPPEKTFACTAPIERRMGKSGSRKVGPQGQAALTEFELLQPLPDGTSLLEARPITGRTNQIRIHLAHLGLPIVGDPLYQAGRLGNRQTLDPDDAPLCLHAHQLTFHHPENQQPVRFVASLPSWADEIRER